MRSRITETGQHGQCAAYVFMSMVISASHNPTSKDQNHHFKYHVARIQRFFQKHVSELFGGGSVKLHLHTYKCIYKSGMEEYTKNNSQWSNTKKHWLLHDFTLWLESQIITLQFSFFSFIKCNHANGLPRQHTQIGRQFSRRENRIWSLTNNSVDPPSFRSDLRNKSDLHAACGLQKLLPHQGETATVSAPVKLPIMLRGQNYAGIQTVIVSLFWTIHRLKWDFCR